MLGQLLSEKKTLPFKDITAANALKVLRIMMGLVGVDDPGRYKTHDLRRGHAKDLQLAGKWHLWFCASHLFNKCYYLGSPLHVILEAGQWSSPAFLKYIDINKLDEELVLHAHCDESSDSD